MVCLSPPALLGPPVAGNQRSLGAVACVELLEDRGHVVLDRLLLKVEVAATSLLDFPSATRRRMSSSRLVSVSRGVAARPGQGGDAPQRGDPAPGHGDVQKEEVGTIAFGEPDGLLAGRGLAHDGEVVRLGEAAGHAFAVEGMVRRR